MSPMTSVDMGEDGGMSGDGSMGGDGSIGGDGVCVDGMSGNEYSTSFDDEAGSPSTMTW